MNKESPITLGSGTFWGKYPSRGFLRSLLWRWYWVSCRRYGEVDIRVYALFLSTTVTVPIWRYLWEHHLIVKSYFVSIRYRYLCWNVSESQIFSLIKILDYFRLKGSRHREFVQINPSVIRESSLVRLQGENLKLGIFNAKPFRVVQHQTLNRKCGT